MSTVDVDYSSKTTPTRIARDRRLGFESMEEESRTTALSVNGKLPPWLAGTLVRVTPALFEIGGRSTRHWFDGLAMLNSFSFSGGAVSYASRFLRSEAYEQARRGREEFIGFANDPCRSLFKRATALFDSNVNDNCNVNVARVGNRHIAMTELPLPLEFDRQTLDTVGRVAWKRRLGDLVSSAHPHYDPRSGELINYVSRVTPRGTTYRAFAATNVGTSRDLATIKVDELAYMHSFGMTERYLVFTEFPLIVNAIRLVAEFAVRPRPLMHYMRWEPERGTRFHVIDRHSGELRGSFESEGFFAFHHVNAFERDGEVVVDLVTHEDGPTAIRLLELERLRDPSKSVASAARLHRYRVPLGGGDVSDERLADVEMELPRINYGRVNGSDYGYVYGAGLRGPGSDFFDQVVKIDVRNGSIVSWSEEGCYPGEPVFVESPDARREDDGVLLSVVLDPKAQRSFVVVLDAATLEELARAKAPHHIPFGFHGSFFDGPAAMASSEPV